MPLRGRRVAGAALREGADGARSFSGNVAGGARWATDNGRVRVKGSPIGAG
jgi:hypothetical protein